MHHFKKLIKEKENGVELLVRLMPGSRFNRIEGIHELPKDMLALKVSVTSIPEGGKANKALICLLAKTFHIARSKIQITSGETSRNKVISIQIDPGVLAGILSPFNPGAPV